MARRLPALAEALGQDPVALCRLQRIDAALLRDPSARVPLDPVLAGLEHLLAATEHPSLGLALSRCTEPGAYHTPALVLLASDTFREGLARAFQLQRLWGDGERFGLAAPQAVLANGAENLAEAGACITFRIPQPRRLGHGVLEVCALAETLAGARALTGRASESALAVGFPQATDAAGELEQFFGVAPVIGCERAYLVLSKSLVDQRLRNANALFCSVFERQALEELARLPPEDDVVGNVRAEIIRGLARGRFGLHDCAGALGTSARTLERRLTERSLRYKQLVESVRCELAPRLLGEPRTIEEVAALLGYTERSSFHRAFVRWFGKTPVAFQRSRITTP
jgi:AraC-like DNA-binding protein